MTTQRLSAFLRQILALFGRFAALLVALLLCIPVLLLPQATAVPAWVWIPLAAINVALLVFFFWRKPAWQGAVIAVAGVFGVGVLAVTASQAFAMTPPITDAAGKPLPGSIATLETVTLNDSEQWVSIRGQDVTKPVLLFLAGGPGGSQLATARYALGGLEEHFVVVNWEQPGAGKSFDAVDRSTMTPERYIEDAHALVMLLRERFGQEKVYVLGESWGSALGIMLVQRFPELFHAFIGTGQMVAFLENDRMCYDFALQWAEERGDAAKVTALSQQGPPPYYGVDVAWQEAAFLMDTFNYMNQNPAIADNGANTFRDLAAPEYGLYDKVKLVPRRAGDAWRGLPATVGCGFPHAGSQPGRTRLLLDRPPRHQCAGRVNRAVLRSARCAAQADRLVRAFGAHALGVGVRPLRAGDGRHGAGADTTIKTSILITQG